MNIFLPFGMLWSNAPLKKGKNKLFRAKISILEETGTLELELESVILILIPKN